ncbi:MAG TPA: precorrin-6y C5,15-methyltransferase (decarboxylating) subunit CbiE [Bacillota bacterium]|nr:precorrin-6y C5,15-methyltransferase (decarboxylating) subunit CbiE [Bacillota bacterium]
MKSITIVGAGMGPATVSRQGWEAIRQADMLLGACRLLQSFSSGDKPTCAEYTPDGVRMAVESTPAERFVVLVSGDTGFYSAAEKLGAALSEFSVAFIPGISSLSYFFARMKKSWQDAALVSCHGREANFVDTVRRHKLTFALTGSNVREMAAQLVTAGYGHLSVTVGANLGSDDERLDEYTASSLAEAGKEGLCVLLVENPYSDPRVRTGIPDEEFIRGDVPMTKAEIRSVSMSLLAVAPDDICGDIGAGTGSVTVEMALAAYRGRVYAIEPNENAVRLVRENTAAFHIGNVTVIPESAPDALASLPALSVAFIGGSGGRIREIIAALFRNNAGVRIVLNAITLETLHEALEAFKAQGVDADVVQISASRARPAGNSHLMTALNPIYIISGGGHA